VLLSLHRWYGLDVRLGSSDLAKLRLFATIRPRSAEEALQLVAAPLSLRIHQDGDHLVLYSKGTAQ
jgi:ferric-dicitrate binding protein FerR (iron transport regulator)